MQELLSSFFRILSYGPIVSLIFGVSFLPVLYMGGESWWLPLELIVALLGYFCWMLAYWWRGYRAGRPHFAAISVVLLIPLVVGVLQCIDIKGLMNVISPKGAELVNGFNALGIAVARHSISIAPGSTHRYILLLLVAVLYFFLALSHCKGRMFMRIMLLGVVCAALGNAVLSFYGFFTSTSKGIINMPVFTGAFLNRNHFGFLMMLGVLCDLGLIVGIAYDDSHRHKRTRFADADGEYDWNGWRKMIIPLGLVLFVLLTALLLSLSRGAFVGTIAALLVFGIIWLFKGRETMKVNRQMVMALMVLVAATFIGAMPHAMDALSKRFEDLSAGEITMDGRWLVWKDSVKLIADYKLSGVGLGCFGDRIQPYEAGHATRALIDHAHNDYLELIAEIGIPMALLVFAGLAVFLFIVLHRCWKVHDPTYKWAVFSLMAAMVGVAVHEAFDYNLRAYPNFLIFATLLAMMAICVRRRGKSEEEITGLSRAELHSLNRKQRYGLRLALLPMTIVLMAVTLPYGVKKLKASIARNSLIDEYETEMSEWTPRPGDFKRRINYAKKALAGYPMDHKTLLYKASAEVGYAMHKSVKRKQAVEFLNAACDDVALACSRAPGNGDTALACAKIFSLANSMMVRNDTLEQQLSLYDWAAQCYPKIIGIVEPVATFACRTYVVSTYVEPENSAKFKEYALKKVMSLIELRPESFQRIYSLLPSLVDGYDKLLDVAPETIPARKELIDFLMEKRQYAVAMKAVDAFIGQLKDASGISEQEVANYRLFAISVQNTLFEVMGEPDRRAENWHRMLAALGECERLKLQGQNASNAKREEFRMKYSDFTMQYYYDKAYNAKNLGRINDVVHFLLPITYGFEKGDDLMLYRNSLALLDGWETYFDESIVVRAKFLENALCVLAAEAGDTQKLSKNIEALEALEEQVARQKTVQWFQRHLIPLYIGRAYEHIGNAAKAIAAYRRCIEISGLNYIALCGIERCSKDLRHDMELEERRVMALIRTRKTPIAHLANGLTWQAMDFRPKLVDKMSGMVESEFVFICRRDNRTGVNWFMEYHDRRGVIFNDEISFTTDAAMMWRIGQIVLVNKRFQPYSETLRARHRIIAQGDIMLRAKVVSIPNTWLKAFEYRQADNSKGK